MIFSTKGVVAALSYLQLVRALANAGSEADHCHGEGLRQCLLAVHQGYDLCANADLNCQCAFAKDVANHCYEGCAENNEILYVRSFVNDQCNIAGNMAAASLQNKDLDKGMSAVNADTLFKSKILHPYRRRVAQHKGKHEDTQDAGNDFNLKRLLDKIMSKSFDASGDEDDDSQLTVRQGVGPVLRVADWDDEEGADLYDPDGDLVDGESTESQSWERLKKKKEYFKKKWKKMRHGEEEGDEEEAFEPDEDELVSPKPDVDEPVFSKPEEATSTLPRKDFDLNADEPSEEPEPVPNLSPDVDEEPCESETEDGIETRLPSVTTYTEHHTKTKIDYIVETNEPLIRTYTEHHTKTEVDYIVETNEPLVITHTEYHTKTEVDYVVETIYDDSTEAPIVTTYTEHHTKTEIDYTVETTTVVERVLPTEQPTEEPSEEPCETSVYPVPVKPTEVPVEEPFEEPAGPTDVLFEEPIEYDPSYTVSEDDRASWSEEYHTYFTGDAEYPDATWTEESQPLPTEDAQHPEASWTEEYDAVVTRDPDLQTPKYSEEELMGYSDDVVEPEPAEGFEADKPEELEELEELEEPEYEPTPIEEPCDATDEPEPTLVEDEEPFTTDEEEEHTTCYEDAEAEPTEEAAYHTTCVEDEEPTESLGDSDVSEVTGYPEPDTTEEYKEHTTCFEEDAPTEESKDVDGEGPDQNEELPDVLDVDPVEDEPKEDDASEAEEPLDHSPDSKKSFKERFMDRLKKAFGKLKGGSPTESVEGRHGEKRGMDMEADGQDVSSLVQDADATISEILDEEDEASDDASEDEYEYEQMAMFASGASPVATCWVPLVAIFVCMTYYDFSPVLFFTLAGIATAYIHVFLPELSGSRAVLSV